MAQVTVRLSGVTLDNAEFQNAATESSLRDIVAELKKISDSARRIESSKQQQSRQPQAQQPVSTAAIDSAVANSANAIDQTVGSSRILGQVLSNSANELGAAVGGTTEAAALLEGTMATASKASAIFGTVMSAISKTGLFFVTILNGLASGAGDLIATFLRGSDQLSEYTEGLQRMATSIPILGTAFGGLIGLIGSVIKQLEDWRDRQFELAEYGAAFSNSLIQMRIAASQTGLSLDKYSSIVRDNTQVMSHFGGTVSAGSVRFSNISNVIMRNFGNRLNAMNLSVEQINEQLPEFLAIQASGAKARNDSDIQLASSAVALMGQMDAMAKITGESRKQQLDELKKRQMTAAYQMKMAGMSSDQQSQLNQQMAQMRAQFGDVGSELVMLSTLGMPALTNSAKMFTATMPGAAAEIRRFNTSIQSNVHGLSNFSDQLDDSAVAALKSAGKDVKARESILRAAAAGIAGPASDMASIMNELVIRQTAFLDKDGTINETKFRQALQEARNEQSRRDAFKNTLDNFSLMVQRVRNVFFNNVIKPILDGVEPAVRKLANMFEFSSNGLSDKLADWGKVAGEWVKQFTIDIFTPEGREAMMSKIVGFFEILAIKIQEKMGLTSSATASRKIKEIEDAQKLYDTSAKVKQLEFENLNSDLNRARLAKQSGELLFKAREDANKSEQLALAELAKKNQAVSEAEANYAQVKTADAKTKLENAILERDRQKTQVANIHDLVEQAIANFKKVEQFVDERGKLKQSEINQIISPEAQTAEASRSNQIESLKTQMRSDGEAIVSAINEQQSVESLGRSLTVIQSTIEGFKNASPVPIAGTPFQNDFVSSLIGKLIGASAGFADAKVQNEKDAQAAKEAAIKKIKEKSGIEPVSRASGSLGATGKLIEDFGKETPAFLHGQEGVITKTQLAELVKDTLGIGFKAGNQIININWSTNTDFNKLLSNTNQTLNEQLPKFVASVGSNSAVNTAILDAIQPIDQLNIVPKVLAKLDATADQLMEKIEEMHPAKPSVTLPISQSAPSIDLTESLNKIAESNSVLKQLLTDISDKMSINNRLNQTIARTVS